MAKSPTQFVDIQTAPAQVNGCQAVTPGLLISSFAVEASESQLREQGVTHILQVRDASGNSSGRGNPWENIVGALRWLTHRDTVVGARN